MTSFVADYEKMFQKHMKILTNPKSSPFPLEVRELMIGGWKAPTRRIGPRLSGWDDLTFAAGVRGAPGARSGDGRREGRAVEAGEVGNRGAVGPKLTVVPPKCPRQ